MFEESPKKKKKENSKEEIFQNLLKEMEDAESIFFSERDFTLVKEIEKIIQIFSEKFLTEPKLKNRNILKKEQEISIKMKKEEIYSKFNQDFIKLKEEMLQKIAPNIKIQELWKLQVENSLKLLQEITDLKFNFNFFKEENLPPGSYQNLPFILALLIVEHFLNHPLASGFYRKHDGFEAKIKDNNTDIINHFTEKIPKIMVDDMEEAKNSYGFTYPLPGVDRIFLNYNLYSNAMEIQPNETESIMNYSFIIAITLLHEICHFKIRNFQKENKESSPKEFNESGNFFESQIFHGRLGSVGKDFKIDKLLICVQGQKTFKEFPVNVFKKWFKEDFWKNAKSQEDFKFSTKELKVFKKGSKDYVQKELEMYELDLDSFDRMKCGTKFIEKNE